MVMFHCYVSSPEGTDPFTTYLPSTPPSFQRHPERRTAAERAEARRVLGPRTRPHVETDEMVGQWLVNGWPIVGTCEKQLF